MISDGPVAIRKTDLEAAVAAGVIDGVVADRLVAFVETARGAGPSQADEENLRLISSFNDIFVTIGLVLFLGALTYIVSGLGVSASALIIAAASWGLAEVFTRIKRLALPSIVLLVVYSLAAFICIAGWLAPDLGIFAAVNSGGPTLPLAAAGIVTTALVGVHWLRFRVPITIAAGCCALAITAMALAGGFAPELFKAHSGLVTVPLGLAIFGLAMWYDMSDRHRLTRRTDIAFWLHLLAAPMIVHPIVAELTTLGNMTPRDAGLILALFVVLSIVALVADRRALLVSSLIYLGYAAYTLISKADWGSSTYAFAVLMVGAIVLLLSVAWRPLRRLVLELVPGKIRGLVPEPA
ncbi:MAG: hypothetical protein H7X89_12565 [Rhizobiales bacterium]|nr:hypothetical protein [Hyphomicrobiales bacterium]